MKKLLLANLFLLISCVGYSQVINAGVFTSIYKLKYLKGYSVDSLRGPGITKNTWDKLTEWSELAFSVKQSKRNLIVPDPQDFHVKFKLMYNDSALFGLVDIVDDAIIKINTDSSFCSKNGDFISILIAQNMPDYWPASLFFGVDNTYDKTVSISAIRNNGEICLSNIISDNHYQLQFSIPWRVIWTVNPDKPISFPDDTMNFEIGAYDIDAPFGNIQSQIQWGDSIDMYYMNYMNSADVIIIDKEWDIIVMPEKSTASSSDTVVFVSDFPATTENKKTKIVEAYPNPVNSILNFNAEVTGSLINMQGIMILHIIKRRSVNLEGLPAGTYILKTSNNETILILKL